MSARKHHQQWEHHFAQKKQELLESQCQRALEMANSDAFEAALEDLAVEYKAARTSNFIGMLVPSLPHLRSFIAAVGSASQSQALDTLILGAPQAVLETACQNDYAVEKMLDITVELIQLLPQLDSYFDLLKNDPRLQNQLQNIYDSYMDFCISSIQYMKRSSMGMILNSKGCSGARICENKEKLSSQTENLKQALEFVRVNTKKHKAIHSTLSTEPLSEIPRERAENVAEEVEWPVTTVALYRNQTFLGRDDMLTEMHEKLVPPLRSHDNQQNGKSHEQPRCVILHGLGGIGKTQIALEYTYRYQEDYDAIFWVQSDQDHSLAATFSYIAEQLQMVEGDQAHDGQGQGRAVKRANKWLHTTDRKWLIVFDNVENMDDLNPYFPLDVKRPGSVIITTQRSDFFPLTRPDSTLVQHVKNLSRDQGAELVFTYLQRPPLDPNEEETAKQISDLLDGLPLALATIGGYINQSGDTVSNYYENLRTSSKAWEAGAIGPVKQYEKRLETVFDKALQELPGPARKFLNILAFLNPDHIPELMFTENLGKPEMGFIKSKADLVDIIRILRKRQLVRRDTISGSRPFLSVHRTVQWSVLLDLSKDYQHRWQVFQQAFTLIRHCLPKSSSIDNPEPEYWAEFERYVPQLLQLRSHCLWPEPPVRLPQEFASVLSSMATYMWHAGLFTDGTEALLTAEEVLNDNSVGKKDPLRGSIHAHLGIFASFNGVSERKFTLERREKAIEAREAAFARIPKDKVTRDDEIVRWNVESDMAYGYIQWEDFDRAEAKINECLRKYKSWGDEKEIPFEYVKYNQIMSYVYMAKQMPIKAIECAKKGSELAEVCATLMHPTTQLLRTTLANNLYLAGELGEAFDIAEGVLRARKEIHGEFNHYTLESYSFCASLLAKKGQHEKAEEMYLKCLDRRKRSAWNQEGVARAQFLYGQTLLALGRVEDAGREMNEAREMMEYYLDEYPEWLSRDSEGDELVVLDQMVSLWACRYTGKLKQR